MRSAPVVLIADENECSFQFAPEELRAHIRYRSSCDIAKSALAGRFVSYRIEPAAPGATAVIRIGSDSFEAFDGRALSREDIARRSVAYATSIADGIAKAGYPTRADEGAMNKPVVFLILCVLVLYVTMVYGPLAAMLVELFPTRIRYFRRPLPYHVGNGWFGGFLPTFAFAMVAATGDIHYGLWYPIIIALAAFVIGLLAVPETRDRISSRPILKPIPMAA